MPIYLQAITPKRLKLIDEAATMAAIRKNMSAYLETCKKDLQEYPPQQERPRRSVRGFIVENNIRMTLTQAAELEGRRLRTRNEPSRRYKRTEILKKSWKIILTPDGTNGFLINDAKQKGRPYAVFVQGPVGGGRGIGQRQTRLNRSKGWKSITDVTRARRKEFTTVMNRAVKGGVR